MGPTDHLDITGAKGGESKPKSPVEAPDSLQSTNIAKLLLAVGEGEFDGAPTDRDIYLDNTPIMDASGNVNFPGVKWEWRPGSVEQDYIQGIPSVENETTVNVELRSDNPFTRALSNTQLSAVRVRMSWPRLAQQDSSGNTNGYRIEYAIDIATDGGAYVEAHLGAVDGKTTNGYQRSVRVNLPAATSGWMLRVRRITPNANSGTVADTMTIAGYTEIIDEKLRYPNTALLYIEFDAQQFQNIPAVTVKCKAKRWPVPSNYDPVTRTYTGVWDGTFKQAWTNNPAFVTYGLCVEDRFGLGKRIKSWMVDKWEMYRIAQYCDQLVSDGRGGQEPRYLCDMNLQGRAEAWTLLRDLSAIYRGMVYWAHGSLFMQADMPRAQDIDYVFTRANVIDGEFVYGGAERNTHYSRALVSYDNPANNYDTDVIPVTDNALQRRYRDRPVEISAIGCTRASEAQRRGKWALLSNSQDRTVSFKTGMEGRIPLPGYVIPVADELVAGRPNGGRISSAAGRVVTLDRDTPIKAGDRLIVNLPNGTAQARTVQSVSGRAVTVTTAYGVQPEPELQWAIDYDDLAVQLFRVLKTTRTQEGDYEITALEFNPSKFAAIDTGAKLDERPISVIPVTTVQPPASVTLTSAYAVDQGIGVNTMAISWPAVSGAVAYDVEWRKDNGNWVRVQRTGAASVDVVGIYAGAYLARVRAVSSFDITSTWRDSMLTQLKGKEGLPPAVAFLTATPLVFGTRLNWGFPAGAEDTERTEIWQSATTSRDEALKMGDFAYPQAEHEIHGLAAGVSFFYWARLVDRSGNVGPWYPTGVGVNGQSSSNQSEYEEYFKDKIGNGALYPELREEIALISGPPELPGSVNNRLKELDEQVAGVTDQLDDAVAQVQSNLDSATQQAQQNLATAKQQLQEQIDTVSVAAKALPYNKDKAYSAGQTVLGADGKLYQASQAVPKDTAPPNASYWTDIGQAVQTANGLAVRMTTVETKVTEQDGKLTAQSTRIDGVQSSLTTTNQNVTAAQQAAQDAATLAGGKGKVIVQSAAPAVADRLAQNLWIDTTGNANTPKRWSGSAWVAVTDKVATDAAAAAANALSVAQTKADTTAVSQLSSTVSQQGDTITAQGQALTGVQATLTTTSQNVTAAQQAAQDAATLAGGKGKVIVQSATPAAADRLVQNLWIDTTGNANTPKRWSGSAWMAVTDKVATDAAAAAANALSVAQTKADASAVSNLTNRVTEAEGNISAQGQAITGVQSSLTTTNQNVTSAQQAAQAASDLAGGKGKVMYQTAAPAAADRLAQNLWIDTTGGANTPKRWSGSAWVAVTDKVATDAAAAAANALALVQIKADASAVSNLDNRVSSAEGKIEAQGTALTSVQAAVGNIAGNGANLVPAEYAVFGPTSPALVMGGGQAATVEADPHGFNGYVLRLLQTSGTGTTYFAPSNIYSGANIALKNKKYILAWDAKSTSGAKQMQVSLRTIAADGAVRFAPGQDVAITDQWARYSVVFDLTNAAFVADRMMVCISASPNPKDGIAVLVDRVMLEEQVGAGTVPSTFSIGNSAGQVGALANTVNQLDARVVQTETGLTSQGTALTGLQNSLTTTNQNVTAAQQAAQTASDLAGGKGKVMYQATAPAVADRLAQNLWIDTTGNANTPKRWSGSAWVAVTDKVASDAAAAAASALSQVATKADASTVQQLSNTVSQQGQTVTAQGQVITNIQTSVGNSSQDNLLRNPDFNAAGDLVDNSTADFKMEYFSKTDAGVPAAAPANRLLCMSKLRDVSGWGGQALVFTNGSVRTPATPGEVLNVECQMFCESATTNAGKIAITYWIDGNTSVSGNVRILGYKAADGGWQKLTVQVTVPAQTTEISLYVVPDGPAVVGFKMWIANLKIARQGAGEAALASATQQLDSRVSQTESGLTSQGSAITNLTNSLSTTNQNVTAAQQAAQAASDLAGGKGKVIIQSATPATADRLAQNLWIDTTGNANTPKRWSGSTWVAVTDKVATDAATAAASALSQVAAKADASTVQALTNTVTQQGTTITAQGSEITNIKASVGVVSAENLLFNPAFADGPVFSGSPGFSVLARNDASVPVGAPSPRVVKWPVATSTGNNYLGFQSALNVRPPENAVTSQIAVAAGEIYDFELYAYSSVARQHGLWIQFYDLDGLSVGHNWAVAAGDGVRLTAAAQIWTKLTGQATVPAGCVRMAMTFRVSVGDATDVFLSSPIARKRAGQDNAQASALQSVDARVSVTEGTVSSQGSAITQLNNAVAGKADNSALQSLQGTVTQQGNTLSSQGQAVTQLQSTIGNIGGSGSNLVPSEYSVYNSVAPSIGAISTGLAVTTVADAATLGGYALKFTSSSTSTTLACYLHASNVVSAVGSFPMSYITGKYIISFYAKASVAGRQIRAWLRALNSADAAVNATSALFTLTTEWVRYSAVIDLSNATTFSGSRMVFAFQPNTSGVSGTEVWVDRVMAEKQIGTSAEPSVFDAGTSYTSAAAQATAISQLNTTVNQQGTAITAQASRLDGLYVQVNPEMEGDSTGLAGAAGSLVGVWTEQSARIEDGVAMGKRVDTVQSQMGDVSASVQQVSETIAGVDGKVSAMTTIKAETISGGRRVMAGLALGSDGETSEILAYAQRFAIVDESSGQMTLPFVVSNGQVFINQAVINQAFIQNLVLGMTLRSQAVNSQGLPLIEINLVTGAFTVRGQDSNGSTLLNNGGLYVYDANGIERTAVGRLT
ncbi:DUF1983 domain-containing protein [Pseudomonas putida]|nr:DUF1983 domain-containing protein [Pseudomonas putida]MDY4320805.1 DUF1983 domain-containing protein [Pseudomonas putida]MDY4354096.1 DUF1983 domain-containing protein [Pseudomonas putida]